MGVSPMRWLWQLLNKIFPVGAGYKPAPTVLKKEDAKAPGHF
jgi:hypothetical protein